MSDTTEVQALLDAVSAPGVASLDPGRVYTLAPTGTRPARITGGSNQNQPYSLLLPSGVTLDLNGARLRLANGANCAAIINHSILYSDTPDQDCGIINGTIDGNGANQATPASGLANTVILINIDGLTLDGLTFTDAYNCALRLQKVTDLDVGSLLCDSSGGDGFIIGLYATTFAYDARVSGVIDRLEGRNCLSTRGVGNPIALTGHGLRVGQLIGSASAGGHKIQDGSDGIAIGYTRFEGSAVKTPANSSVNSGTKIQGTAEAPCNNIAIGRVESSNCEGDGLYIENAYDVSIFDFHGSGDGTAGSRPDVWVGAGARRWIGSIDSRGAGQVGVMLRADSNHTRIERATVVDPSSTLADLAAVQVLGGRAHIGSLHCSDTRGTPRMRYGIFAVAGVTGEVAAFTSTGQWGAPTLNGSPGFSIA